MSKSENQSLRWWIVEDALRDRKGHWVEYLQTFQRGLSAEGDQVRFFASKECVPDVAQAFNANPILPKSIWARMSDGAPKWRRLVRIPAHGLATYRAVSRMLDECSVPYAPLRSVGAMSLKASSKVPGDRTLPDLIFVPTVLMHHLVGWIPLIKWRLRNLPCRVLLFFPNAPVDLNEDGTAHLLPDPTAKLFKFCIRCLAKEAASGKVIFGAETQPMAKALSEVTGVRFTYLPHPVELSETQAPAAPEEPITFACYGAARYEKGSDVLQAAIRQVLETNPEVPACFVFQWPEDFADEEGRLVRLDTWLHSQPKVQILRNLFPEGGYERELRATDVMILPYRNAYRLRVSRVVIEAINLGMPVIATRGTTLMAQAEKFGAAVACEEGSVDDLAQAILAAINDFSRLRASARVKAEASRLHFSVGTFRAGLLP